MIRRSSAPRVVDYPTLLTVANVVDANIDAMWVNWFYTLCKLPNNVLEKINTSF